MKVITYDLDGLKKMFPWSEEGEEIARKEADSGEYSVVDIPEEEAAAMGFLRNDEPSTDDVINALLGVTK